MGKTNEQLMEDGIKLKMYRELMSIKQKDMAKKMNTNQSNYCRMEQGRLDSKERLQKVINMFMAWRNIEINSLRTQIEYLKSL